MFDYLVLTTRNCRGLSRWCSVSKWQAKCWKRMWWGITWTFLVEKDLRGVVGGYVLKWAWCFVMAKNQLAAIRSLLRKRAGTWVQIVVVRMLCKPIVYSQCGCSVHFYSLLPVFDPKQKSALDASTWASVPFFPHTLEGKKRTQNSNLLILTFAVPSCVCCPCKALGLSVSSCEQRVLLQAEWILHKKAPDESTDRWY